MKLVWNEWKVVGAPPIDEFSCRIFNKFERPNAGIPYLVSEARFSGESNGYKCYIHRETPLAGQFSTSVNVYTDLTAINIKSLFLYSEGAWISSKNRFDDLDQAKDEAERLVEKDLADRIKKMQDMIGRLTRDLATLIHHQEEHK